jgi:flagellar basal-body rod protein FlgB
MEVHMLNDYTKFVNDLSVNLDSMMLRSKLIASNVANVDTPGYKSRDINFQDILSESMGSMKLKRTDPRHLGEMGISNRMKEIVEDPNPGRPDGNNVDIDDEMLKLTENNIQYNAAIQFVSRKIKQVNDAIQAAK